MSRLTASARHAWLAFLLVASLLAGGLSYAILDHQARQRATLEEEFQTQLEWLRFVVFTELHRSDYESTAALIHRWAARTPSVVQVALTTRNGFAIVDYRQPSRSDQLMDGQIVIPYSYNGEAALRLVMDNGPRLDSMNMLAWRVGALYLLFMALAAVLLHQRVLRQQQADALQVANRTLANEIEERSRAEANAARLERQHRLLLEASAEGIYGIDREGRCTFVNPAALRMLGYAQSSQWLGQSVHQLIHYRERSGTPLPEIACRIHQVIISGRPAHGDDEVFWRADGTPIDVEYSAQPLLQDGQTIGAVVSFSDISERRRRDAELRKLSMAVGQSPAAVVITDRAGFIEYVSPAFERNSGYAASEVLGRALSVVTRSPETATDPLKAAIVAGEEWRGELCSQHKNGRLVWERALLSPVRDGAGIITHFVLIKEDVTLEHDQAALIRYQAEYDALTGVPNRMLTLDRLTQAINKARRSKIGIALLFIDLDDFKKINDTLGHDYGDKLLIEATQRFKAAVREGDTVGRQGGDEFLVVLENLDGPAAAERVARDILRQCAAPFRIDNIDLMVTASVGIALFPADGDDPATLLRHADAAMYSAKESGRNNFSFFAPEMNRDATQRVELEHHLLGALERGELRLEFQPQVDLARGELVAAEALLRWRSPILGDVAPAQFIPLAEQTGYIVPIGRWVLEETCRMVAIWREGGNGPPRVAVNISPRQFHSTVDGQSIADLVLAALDHHRLPPDCIELEITEGLLVRNWSHTRPMLMRLHDRGIRVSMDDFGTGYSSLAYLRSFPFDMIKIDRSFIGDLERNREDQTLVHAIIAMAHSLDIEVLAEGVETQGQATFLSRAGCHFGQGHLFGRPTAGVAFGQQAGGRPINLMTNRSIND